MTSYVNQRNKSTKKSIKKLIIIFARLYGLDCGSCLSAIDSRIIPADVLYAGDQPCFNTSFEHCMLPCAQQFHDFYKKMHLDKFGQFQSGQESYWLEIRYRDFTESAAPLLYPNHIFTSMDRLVSIGYTLPLHLIKNPHAYIITISASVPRSSLFFILFYINRLRS